VLKLALGPPLIGWPSRHTSTIPRSGPMLEIMEIRLPVKVSVALSSCVLVRWSVPATVRAWPVIADQLPLEL
jgi:hypothetical protein